MSINNHPIPSHPFSGCAGPKSSRTSCSSRGSRSFSAASAVPRRCASRHVPRCVTGWAPGARGTLGQGRVALEMVVKPWWEMVGKMVGEWLIDG